MRGGVPLCWPWLGLHPEHREWGLHGPLRTHPFTITSETSTDAQLSLSLQTMIAAPAAGILIPCAVSAEFCLARGLLQIDWRIRNLGSQAQPSAGAMHTYIRIDPRHARLEGFAGCTWHGPDNSDLHGPVDETLDDFVGQTYTIHDGPQQCQPQLVYPNDDDINSCHLSRLGSSSLIVCNPGRDHGIADLSPEAWQQFLCIESANSDHDARIIAPQQSRHMRSTYRWRSNTPQTANF